MDDGRKYFSVFLTKLASFLSSFWLGKNAQTVTVKHCEPKKVHLKALLTFRGGLIVGK